MREPLNKHLNHQLPAWVRYDATFFVTVCAKPRKLNQLCCSKVGGEILQTIRYYQEQRKWFCHIGLLMPDHAHLLLCFPDVPSFSKVVDDWKRWQTIHHKIVWQENFFEHRLRDQESFDQKAEYILQNPVRAGLVNEAKDWPYQWIPGQT